VSKPSTPQQNADNTNRALDRHLEYFFEDLNRGRTPGGKEGLKKMPEFTYRLLNSTAAATLLELPKPNLSDIQDRLKMFVQDGSKTAISAVTGILGFCQSLVVASGQQPLQDIDREYLQNPDLYLFLLCSPAVDKILQQGGLNKFGQFVTFAIDRITGLKLTSYSSLDNIKDQVAQLQDMLFPGVPKQDAFVETLISQLQDFVTKKCHLSYYEKYGLARDIANLVKALQDESLSLGTRSEQVLEFADRHGITDIVIKNSDDIAELACNIWAKNARETEAIGFDERAVLGMKPVIKLVLEEGLSKKGASFQRTKAFVKTLVDMITMSYADPQTPALVDLTECIFNLTAANETIRKRLSSDGEDKLTPESEGLNEYFRGYFTNLFRHKGLSMSLQNALDILEDQQSDAIKAVSQTREQRGVASEIKSVFHRAKQEIEQCLTNIHHAELSQQNMAKADLLKKVSEWGEKYDEILRNNQQNNRKITKRLERMGKRIEKFALTHHLEDTYKKYLDMVDDKEAMERERIRINDDIKRTEYNESFLHGEEVIAKARSETDRVLIKHDLSYLMRQDLSALPSKEASEIRDHAKREGLVDTDIEHILATPEYQKALRSIRYSEYAGSKNRAERVQAEAPKVKNLVKSIKRQLSRCATGVLWWVQCILHFLTIPNASKWVRRMQMGAAAFIIQESARTYRNDNTDIARIIKSLDMIIKFNPEFWRWLTKNKGQDINQLVNAVVIDQQTQSYLLTRPDRIAGNIKGIFEYVIRTAIVKKATYGPVNLLLSTWTDPESFDRRYRELEQKYQDEKQRPHKHWQIYPKFKPKGE